MIVYLIKSGLCLAFLLGIYLLFLEREKMHRFNRFFLLFALVFGLSVPLFTIDVGDVTQVRDSALNAIPASPFFEQIPSIAETIPATQGEKSEETISNLPVERVSQPEESSPISIADILLAIYLTGVFIFAIRFLMSLVRVTMNRINSETRPYGGTTLVLMGDSIIPHSFLNWIFLPKKAYLDQLIEDEVFAHELVHIREKHSWDVLFIEALKTIFWFNPIFYFYKKAIQLNHEFIADQVVADSTAVLRTYQQLLLKYAGLQSKASLTSNLDYQLTKRRLMMMNQKKSTHQIVAKKALLIPVILFSVLLFSDTTKADLIPEAPIVSEINAIDSTHSGSPYYDQFAGRLNTYQNVYSEYEAGEKSKRDVLYQRIRLVWLHQRLHPDEQRIFKVPDLPENFADDVPLSEAEKRYQEKHAAYITYRESLEELPLNLENELYNKLKELRTAYEELDFHAQIFIVNNLPNKFIRHLTLIDQDKEIGERSLPPFEITLSKQDQNQAVHYLDLHGNVVVTTVGGLSEQEIEYLINNTKKSLVTQVYPLPEEQKPTDEEIEKWQDDYIYQIWLDGEQIENERLLEMDMDTIHHFRIHEARWNANRRVPYDYQIQIHTHESFAEMVKKYRPSKGMLPYHLSIILK